jgi:hypothetical protein
MEIILIIYNKINNHVIFLLLASLYLKMLSPVVVVIYLFYNLLFFDYIFIITSATS